MKKKFIVGIDLGTTNSSVSYISLHEIDQKNITVLNIPQLLTSGRLGTRKILPSFLYIPEENEFLEGEISLPWDPSPEFIVGEYARELAVKKPERVISSAKSWLCHAGVDREDKILPFGSNEVLKKLSPVEASKSYLEHIKLAWNHIFGNEFSLEKQEIILTVPASFDEVARELTLKAAQYAGLENVTLLEEPLAAFYSWLYFNNNKLDELQNEKNLILVCDIGGGTTDFTLIEAIKDEKPIIKRLAVGDHLLLGGDNIDLTIASIVENKIGEKLSFLSWQNLIHQARNAKEQLFSEDENIKEVTIILRKPGKAFVGGTTTIKLTKNEIYNQILDGFFPIIDLDACNITTNKTGISELGLPYEEEPAITKHMGFFLKRHSQELPSAVLFNGGSVKPNAFRRRIIENLQNWSKIHVKELTTYSLDLAISIGAVYYGLTRHGIGIKVGGGIARSYYIGISSEHDEKALCIVSQGTEEGTEINIEKNFKARTNMPVKFSLYASNTRQNDKIGDIVTISNEFFKLPPLQTILKYGKKEQSNLINVNLNVHLTETGVLEIFCKSIDTPHKWRLQFMLRKAETPQEIIPEGIRVIKRDDNSKNEKYLTDADKKALEDIISYLEQIYGQNSNINASQLKEMSNKLNELAGMPKENWSLALLREIADKLLTLKNGRYKSDEHELRWLNLCGFCMRPGLGHNLDPWRIKKIWAIYLEGLKFPKNQENRRQWWIFLRRVCAGFTSGQQTQVFHALKPYLLKESKESAKKVQFKPNHEEKREMWFLACSLQKLDVDVKIQLGNELLNLIKKGEQFPGIFWAFSRIGERVPLYFTLDKVIPARIIQSWLSEIKRLDNIPKKHILSTIIPIARMTGDRLRDLPSDFREELCIWLKSLGLDEHDVRPLLEVIHVDKKELELSFGEGLPEGLVLECETQ